MVEGFGGQVEMPNGKRREALLVRDFALTVDHLSVWGASVRTAGCYRIMTLALFCLVLSGCSQSKETEPVKAGARSATEQAADAVKEYGRKPIDKARTSQQLGEERTRAIDEAVNRQ